MHIRILLVFVILGAFMASSDTRAVAGPVKAAPAPATGGLLDGTPEERRACFSDVRRHCREAMPDTFRILSCLKDHRDKISKPCLAVLESHGQ